MVKIKICGITNKEDAIEAARLNVDMLGFIFYEKSKRAIDTKKARDIIGHLPPFIARVGVFVNEKKEEVLRIAKKCGLDMLQFHGDEDRGYCDSFKGKYKTMKAFRVKGTETLSRINSYSTSYYFLDTYQEGEFGGTGKSFDWNMLKGIEFARPIILSGGLTPDNVLSAIDAVNPYGVDVSSGIEARPGKKDKTKMREFVKKIREKGL